MKYNKSEIMKEAWIIRKMSMKWVNPLSFADCLRRAWAKAKKEARQFSGVVRNVRVAGTLAHPINVDIDMDAMEVTGNTYPVRRMLRDMGLTWNKYSKSWTGSREILNSICVKYA